MFETLILVILYMERCWVICWSIIRHWDIYSDCDIVLWIVRLINVTKRCLQQPMCLVVVVVVAVVNSQGKW